MQRVRTKGGLYPEVIVNTTTFTDHTGSPEVLQTVALGTQEEMTDIVTPKYKKTSAHGGIINSPMSGWAHVFSRKPGYLSLYYNGVPPPGGAVSGTWTGLPMSADFDAMLNVSPLADWSSLVTEASVNALAKVQKPDANTLPFVAQFGQLLKTIRNPLGNIKKFLDAKLHEKNSSKRRAQMAASIGSQHLEIVFGVMPAINDIREILRTYQAAQKPLRHTARGKSSRDVKWSRIRPYDNYPGVLTGEITDVASRHVEVRAYVLYEMAQRSLSHNLGISLQEVPQTLWEVTPWSFLVDEFINIGKIIDALKPRLGINILAQGYTAKVRDELTSSLPRVSLTMPGWSGSGGGEQRMLVRSEKYRLPLDLSNNIGLVFNPRVNLSVITTDISLITQKIARIYKK